MTQKNEKGKSGGFLWNFILIIALGVFIFAGYKLITIYLEYRKGAEEYAFLERYVESDNLEETEEEGPEDIEEEEHRKNPIDFDELKKINDEIIGWIKIKAIDASYPIAQAEDNEYYLHRTFEKKEVFAGCIFADYNNKNDFTDQTTIIYGHNMKDGSMFGKLKQFRDPEVYEDSSHFWIYTPEKIMKYKIFSCQEVPATSEHYVIRFKDEKEFDGYLKESLANSVVKTDVEVNSGDRIVNLSTCTGNDTTRFLVQGKLVKTILVD